jgi:hypothetical protein
MHILVYKSKVKEQTDIGKSAHCSEKLDVLYAHVAITDRQNQSDAGMIRIGGWDLQTFSGSQCRKLPERLGRAREMRNRRGTVRSSF